jgi:hypothetical protein
MCRDTGVIEVDMYRGKVTWHQDMCRVVAVYMMVVCEWVCVESVQMYVRMSK